MRRAWPWLLLLAASLFTYRFLFSGTLQAPRDLFRLFIPESAYLRERLLQGELPLWNPYARLGQPFLATLYTQVLYPPRVLFVLAFGPAWGMNLLIAFHAALASAGAFLAARRLGAQRTTALLAGLYGFTPMFNRMGQAQHVASAAAWSGFVVLGALAVARARQPGWRQSARLALPLGLSFLCGAPEMVIWQSLLALAALWWSRQPRRALPWLAVGVGWGGLLGAVTALPAAELLWQWRSSNDSLVDRFEWSASFPQLLSMAALFADEKKALYWNEDQWFITSLFIGALPCALAVLSLRRSRRVLPLALVGALCGTLALGSHFVLARGLLSLPPLSFFRYPTKYAVGLAFVVALLAPLGARRVGAWARRVEPGARLLAYCLGAGFAALALGVWVAGLPYWRAGIQVGVFCFAVTCLSGVAAFFAVRPGPARPSRVRAGLVLVAAVECVVAQWLVPIAGTVPAARLEQPSALAAAIRSQSPGRVSIWHSEGDLPGRREASRASPAEEANAFVAESRDNLVPLRWLEEDLSAVEGYGFRDPDRLAAALESDPRPAYDLFGVTHYVRTEQAPWADLTPLPERASHARAFRSATAFPRAFVVTRARVADDARALRAVREEPLLLRQTVLLPPGPELPADADCESSATVVSMKAERSEVEVQACAEGHLVLSDSFFPGWKASVDGVEAAVLRADFLLRAVRVPQGGHRVVFWYAPWSIRVGGGLSLLAVLALAAAKFLKPLAKPLSSR